MRYYSFYPEKSEAQGVAYAPEDVTFKLLYRRGRIEDWKPIEFTLRGGEYTDYQWNNLGWHVCSDKLKATIVEAASPEDEIQWLPVTVKTGVGEVRRYYILHLTRPHDVLSKTRTVRSGDLVVKPVLNASAVGCRKVFTFSDEGVYVYVDQDVRNRIRAANVTGLELLKEPAVEAE